MLLKIWLNFTSLVAYLLLKFEKNKMLWKNKNFHSNWRTNNVQGIYCILNKKENSDCYQESQTKAAIVRVMKENGCLDRKVSTSLVA